MNRISIDKPSLFQSLFDIWKRNNYSVDFYFKEIFDRSIKALKLKSNIQLNSKDGPMYKSMFIPVGFRVENVALVTALISPLHVTLAFSEITRTFHRRHFHIVEEKIRQYCPILTIEQASPISSEDHEHIEKKIMEWAEKMKRSYGLLENQLAIDLTGGTKPMSVGAQNAAVSLGIPAFYLSAIYDEDTELPIPGTESLVEMNRRLAQTDENMVFVVMPFKQEFDPIYEVIEFAVSDAGLRCVRSDKEIFQGGIMDKVRENIGKAGIIVSELSLHNPNVYYELGLAHAWSKKVVMVTQDTESIPFDLRHLRVVGYDSNDINGLREKLKNELIALKIA